MCTRSRRNCRPTSERGFTLVELLVVIGIITILASLLIPAISSVRATSRQTQCASRLGQIGKAVINATTDGKKLSLIKLEEDRGTDGKKITDNELQTGILRSLEDHMEHNYTIYKCPAATGDDIGDETTIHFGFNGRIGRLHSSDSGKIVALDYGKEVVDFTKPEDWETYKRPRHSDASNVLFFDGHVEQIHFLPPGAVSDTGDPIEPKDYERVEKYWVPTIDRKYVHQAGDGVVYNAQLDIAEPPPQYAESSYNFGRNFTGDRKDYGPTEPEDNTPVLIVIDDSDGAPGFVPSASSGWITQSPKPLAYQENTHKLRLSNQVSGIQAEWSFSNLPNGQYKVHTTWWYTPSRCTASYTIGWGNFGNPDGEELASKECDQIQAPTGFTDDDGWTWEELGTVDVEHGELKVRLGDGIGGASKNLMADAMRIERVFD